MEDYPEVATIPHSRENEEAVIGSVLIDPECKDTLDLQADEFYILRHKWIWQAFDNLRANNTPIDLMTVCSQLDTMGKLADVGGASYLTSLLNQTPTSVNVHAYAEVVRKTSERRGYIGIANMIAQGAYADDLDVSSIIDKLIKVETVKGGTGDLSEALRNMDNNVQARLADPKMVWGIPTGFKDFDVMTGGLHRQQVNLIIGPPGVGKTTFALQVGFDAALQQHRHVAIYEMEMDTERILHRGVYMMGGPAPRKLKSGFFDDGDYPTYINALGQLQSPYLHICDEPMLTTNMLRADLARLRAKFDIELVIIDYMDLLADKDGASENERSRNRSKRCKAIGREANACVISIQSLNKAGIEKAVADIQDMSGPAGNGYDADNIYTMSLDDTNPKLMRLIQIKGRDADGKCNIDLIRQGLRFYSLQKEDKVEKKKVEQTAYHWDKD